MFKLEIDDTNAAFDEYPATEIARILRVIAHRIEHDGPFDGYEYDINGRDVTP